ncbi:MAG: LamG-like jellyroll fold domain-containing protein [Phycisphaerales bacterium JB063]
MKFTTQHLGAGVAALAIGASASAGIVEWQAAVAGDSAGYMNTGIASPIVDNIGSYDDSTNGGVTYEFIVNATNDGVSSALMGARDTGVGDNGAVKWEQWPDTTTFGATAFGVADFDSGVSNIPGVNTHVVFIADGTDMDVYVNGSYSGTMAGASLALSGDVGIGQAYDPIIGNFDVLTGTILGVAVYDSALSASSVSQHYNAYIPEPGSFALLGMGGLAMLRRRRA